MGFDFLDQTPRQVTVDVPKMLEQMRVQVDAFARDEDLAQRVLDSDRGPPEARDAIDWKRFSDLSSELWQTRDWWFGLSKLVPYLILELIKSAPKNLTALEKAQKFWNKPFRWNSTGVRADIAKKYLSVLAELRKQLALLQEAAAHADTHGIESEAVGKFKLYDSLGDEGAHRTAIDVLKKATKAMTGLGLGAYCMGKVTLVNSSRFVNHSSAFYVKNTDEIFLSPDLKGQDVRAVCHEIGHRIHTKLNLRHRATSLYQTVKDRGAWVTPYAKTDAEENFCEMLSFAAVKKLGDEDKDLLRTALPKVKLATTRSVVAAFLGTVCRTP